MPKQKNQNSSKSLHTHLRAISRINVILAGVCLLAIIGIYLWLRTLPQELPVTNESAKESAQTTQGTMAIDTTAMTSAYQEEVNAAVADYNFDSSAKAPAIREAVMALRVPAELKSFHLELVVALEEAQQEEYESAQERITQLEDEYNWFHN